jgi:DeoR/GlpR family transcriptional regulator of sugar metabolism
VDILATIKSISERHQKIYELLRKHKNLSIDKLSSMLEISKMTVRRDLDRLTKKGIIQRIHGRAIISRTNEYEPPHRIRSLEMMQEKQMIGRLAASLIKDNAVIIVDIGSTLLELVRNIPENNNITVITNWIPVVVELSKKRGLFNLVLVGGKVFTDELSIVGGYPEDMLKDFNADIAFLGVGGISDKFGITDFNMDEVQVKKQMIKSSREVIVLADHSKFGRVTPIKIADIKIIDKIITDDGLKEKDKINIERFDTEIIIAK